LAVPVGNTPNAVDFTKTLSDFLAESVDNGTYNDIIGAILKVDKFDEVARASDIDLSAGQLWSNLVDDYMRATWNNFHESIKLWTAADETARDAFGSDNALAVDDVCWVKDIKEFWYVVSVDGAAASTWARVVVIDSVDTERFQIVDGELQLSDNMETAMNLYLGVILETIDVEVTESGGVVSLSLEKDGGGDITCVFSDGYFPFDTTPAATIELTLGTDTTPVTNFVYIDQATKLLTKSTINFPAAEHCPVAEMLVQSAAGVAADGPYIVHAHIDHSALDGDNGHISHMNSWIRHQNATWLDGVSWTLTITAFGGDPDDVIVTTVVGSVLQLHDHVFPAFTGTPSLFVANDFTAKFDKIVDLNEVLTDALGNTMVGKFFSLVVWGVVNEKTGDCKLMVNTPGGSYNNQSDLDDDISNFAVYNIPAVFTGVGFLIAQFNFRHQSASSGTWTLISEIDLRGQTPSTAAGGGAGGGGETLAETLVLGNITSGTNLVVSTGDSIVGETQLDLAATAGDVVVTPSDAVGASGLAGKGFIVTTGDGDGAGAGGPLQLTSGNGETFGTGAGGPLQLTSGDGSDEGNGGPIQLLGGQGGFSDGDGGSISIIGGFAQAFTADGGDIQLIGGAPDGVGAHGLTIIQHAGDDESPLCRFNTTGTNGAASQTFVGTRNPNGNVTGNPGDYYRRVNGTSSAFYLHTGASSSNSDWTDLGGGGATFSHTHKWTQTTSSLRYIPGYFSENESSSSTPGDVKLWLPACKLLNVTFHAETDNPGNTVVGLVVDGTQISTVSVNMNSTSSGFDFDFSGEVNETTAGKRTNISFDPTSIPQNVRGVSIWQML
jgi:hypothetical protein